MKVSVCIATHGALSWEELAYTRARPSAEANDPHSIVSCHLPDGTLAEARNLAAEDASGDWLCFLDADDALEPGYLDAMRIAFAKHTDRPGDVMTESGPRPTRVGELAPMALLVPAVRYVENPGTLRVRVPEAAIPAWGRPIEEINCAVIGTLVPRSLFLHVGGFPEEPIYEDWALWLACIRAGAALVPVPEAVYRAHLRTGSRNHSSAEATEVYWRRRREHEAWLVQPADDTAPEPRKEHRAR